MQKVIQTGRKHWEKEKLLVTSNFSFFHSVFKRLVCQGPKKVSVCGNGLIQLIFQWSTPVKEVDESLLILLRSNHSKLHSLATFKVLCFQHSSALKLNESQTQHHQPSAVNEIAPVKFHGFKLIVTMVTNFEK